MKTFRKLIESFKNRELNECWDTHVQDGYKMKGGKRVPNCVPRNESVELDERFGGDTDTPASPKIKKYIESGKGIIVDVQSSLDKKARFAVYKNPAKGSGQDKVLMATISDPKGGRIKMFTFHGSHVSHQKAMQFAKNHKLVATKDAKGNPLFAKESVELDEAQRPTRIAVNQEFRKVHGRRMDTGKATQHVEKKFNINNVKVQKDKNGLTHVISFNESMMSTGGGIAGMHQSVTPTDGLPQIAGREADRIRVDKKKKKTNETFAGCRVFELTSEEYNKCMRGRMKYERWDRKMNMEDFNNQDIRSYSHRNPGQPIVIKDSTTGIMAYLIPPSKR